MSHHQASFESSPGRQNMPRRNDSHSPEVKTSVPETNEDQSEGVLCANPINKTLSKESMHTHNAVGQKVSYPASPSVVSSSKSQEYASVRHGQPTAGRMVSSADSHTATLPANQDNYSEYWIEQNRLNSFFHTTPAWPESSPVQPKDLAAAGLFYMGTGDTVRCPFCYITLRMWETGDIPMTEHKKFSSKCSFVLGRETRNIPISANVRRSPSFPVEYRQNLFKVSNKAIYPNYEEFDRRVESFEGKELPQGQTVERLAEAGFYHIGPADAVQCFWCGGSLKFWRASDKPWSEHARWFPHCTYLHEMKMTRGSTQATNPASPAAVSESRSGPMDSQAQPVRTSSSELLPVMIEGLSVSDDEDETPNATENLNESHLKQKPMNKQLVSNVGHGSRFAAANLKHQETTDKMLKLEEENNRLKTAMECKVCMSADVNTLFLPCGHLVTCEICATGLKRCPMCRVEIRGTLKIYS